MSLSVPLSLSQPGPRRAAAAVCVFVVLEAYGVFVETTRTRAQGHLFRDAG